MSSPFAFTGEPLDGIGLQYHRARYYDPAKGVWASLDPFEGIVNEPMTLNGYGYVEGNVVNWTDPSGLLTRNCLNSVTGGTIARCQPACEGYVSAFAKIEEPTAIISFYYQEVTSPPVEFKILDWNYNEEDFGSIEEYGLSGYRGNGIFHVELTGATFVGYVTCTDIEQPDTVPDPVTVPIPGRERAPQGSASSSERQQSQPFPAPAFTFVWDDFANALNVCNWFNGALCGFDFWAELGLLVGGSATVYRAGNMPRPYRGGNPLIRGGGNRLLSDPR